jgi:hypothetical protein
MLIRTDALSRSSGNRRTTVAFGRPEPYEWKLSCTVLRGERGGNASDLPGGKTLELFKDRAQSTMNSFGMYNFPFINVKYKL